MRNIGRSCYFIVLLVASLASGCVSLQPQLWPPAPGERTYPVYVSLDTWHGMIGFPSELAIELPGTVLDEPRVSTAGQAKYQEWGYAERKWYVEGQQGSSGAMRALLWPTTGVVEVARYDRLWTERTPQPPADLFHFQLSADGLVRLQRHLLGTLARAEPIAVNDRSVFYRSRQSYHLFHHCHHYVAQALQEAGLPVSPAWAISRTLLAKQLERANRLAEELTPDPSRTAVSKLAQ